jgi:hypothetical protein
MLEGVRYSLAIEAASLTLCPYSLTAPDRPVVGVNDVAVAERAWPYSDSELLSSALAIAPAAGPLECSLCDTVMTPSLYARV